MTDSIAAFYDAFTPRLLANFVNGNTRIERAVAFAVERIPPEARRILDLGCGIGYTSARLKKARPELDVHGVDLSEVNIAAARKLFEETGVQYYRADVAALGATEAYDAIVMIDVFEHIPREGRVRAATEMSRSMSERSSLILTFPSVPFQEYLRHHKPQEIQVVDEDVTADDLCALARALNARVAHYSHVSIWGRNDYCHAVITRGLEYSPSEPRTRLAEPLSRRIVRRFMGPKPSPVEERRRAVRERLGLVVESDGRVIPLGPK